MADPLHARVAALRSTLETAAAELAAIETELVTRTLAPPGSAAEAHIANLQRFDALARELLGVEGPSFELLTGELLQRLTPQLFVPMRERGEA
jgi:hypothetical protein